MKYDPLDESKDLKEKINKLQQKKQQLENETRKKLNWENRKARTKRLIETGALAEKYFGIEDYTIEQREKVFQTFSDFVKTNKVRS